MLWKLDFICPKDHFDEKGFFLFFIIFLSHSDSELGVCSFSSNVLAGSSKLHSMFPCEHFEEKRFSEKKLEVFSTISETEWETVDLLPKKFNWSVKARIYVSIGAFQAKELFLKEVQFSKKKFQYWAKKTSAFCQKNFGGVAKTAFVIPWKHFGGKHFSEKFRENFHLSGHWVKNFLILS